MKSTPSQKWNAKRSKYKEQCQKIVSISNSIRYVVTINEFGRTLSGAHKPDAKPFFSIEQAKNEFTLLSSIMSIRKKHSDLLGGLDHVVFRHGKVSIVLLYKDKVTYYISVLPKEKNLAKIIQAAKKII